MAKSVHNDVLDAMLDAVALGNLMIACSAEPTTRTEAVSTYALSDIALTPGDGNGDFAIADGDSSGRKVTISAQTGVTIDANGDATHIAIVDDTRLLYVTTCSTLTLSTANLLNFPAWKIEVADPS